MTEHSPGQSLFFLAILSVAEIVHHSSGRFQLLPSLKHNLSCPWVVFSRVHNYTMNLWRMFWMLCLMDSVARPPLCNS